MGNMPESILPHGEQGQIALTNISQEPSYRAVTYHPKFEKAPCKVIEPKLQFFRNQDGPITKQTGYLFGGRRSPSAAVGYGVGLLLLPGCTNTSIAAVLLIHERTKGRLNKTSSIPSLSRRDEGRERYHIYEWKEGIKTV